LVMVYHKCTCVDLLNGYVSYTSPLDGVDC